MLAYVVGDLCYIGIVQCSIDFVKHKEGRRLIAVDCEKKGEGGHGLFAAREMIHVSEAFERWHGVVFDAGEIGLIGVFDVEVTSGDD